MKKILNRIEKELNNLNYHCYFNNGYLETSFIPDAKGVLKLCNRKIRVPKKESLNTIEYYLTKLSKTAKTYKNLSDFFNKINNTYLGYPTTYGIGFYTSIISIVSIEEINKLKQILKDNEIDFYCEISAGYQVFRFIISQKATNLEKINKFILAL